MQARSRACTAQPPTRLSSCCATTGADGRGHVEKASSACGGEPAAPSSLDAPIACALTCVPPPGRHRTPVNTQVSPCARSQASGTGLGVASFRGGRRRPMAPVHGEPVPRPLPLWFSAGQPCRAGRRAHRGQQQALCIRHRRMGTARGAGRSRQTSGSFKKCFAP